MLVSAVLQISQILFSLCFVCWLTSFQPTNPFRLTRRTMTAEWQAVAVAMTVAKEGGDTHPFHFPIPDTFVRQLSSYFFAPFSAFGKLAAGKEFPHKQARSEMDLCSCVWWNGEWWSDTKPKKKVENCNTLLMSFNFQFYFFSVGSVLKVMPFLSWELFALQCLSSFAVFVQFFSLTTIQQLWYPRDPPRWR